MSKGPVLIDFCPCECRVFTQERGIAGWPWRRPWTSALYKLVDVKVDWYWQERWVDRAAVTSTSKPLLNELWIGQLRYWFQFNWIQINMGAPRYVSQKSCSYNMAGTFRLEFGAPLARPRSGAGAAVASSTIHSSIGALLHGDGNGSGCGKVSSRLDKYCKAAYQ